LRKFLTLLRFLSVTPLEKMQKVIQVTSQISFHGKKNERPRGKPRGIAAGHRECAASGGEFNPKRLKSSPGLKQLILPLISMRSMDLKFR
jgi:hypothetical protein